jgi:hypothetical protein
MKNKKVCNFIEGFDVFLQLSRRLFINWGEALNFPSSSFLTRSKPQSTYMAVRRAPTHWYYTFPMSYINFLVTFCKSVVCREKIMHVGVVQSSTYLIKHKMQENSLISKITKP